MPKSILKIESSQTFQITIDTLLNGEIVAIPTDTVYGIACLAMNERSIESLYKIKQRDDSKPIPVLIGELQQVFQLTPCLTANAEKLINHFWPGALTIIFEKKRSLPKNLSNLPTIGIRMPDHHWLRKLITETGPLAVTSANISGSQNQLDADGVSNELGEDLSLIIDGGPCEVGIPSTVVDCSQGKIQIIREGVISKEEIMAII